MISLQDAVDDLYRIAVAEQKRQSPSRLAKLGEMCVEQLDERGVNGAAMEIPVPGIGRSKTWDVAWPSEGRVRLGISLKSILRNIAGAVPNRVDDLTGEMANVQLLSPEIVTGYVVIFDTTQSGLRKDGTRWEDFFRDAVNRLSGRDAPAWAAGMVEASAIVEVDFSEGPRIVTIPDMSAFFDRLASCVRDRNPDRFVSESGT